MKARFSKAFSVGQQDADDKATYHDRWLGRPGYVPGHKNLWSVGYRVDGESWAVGIAFHRMADAELCRDFLIKHGYTPRRFHEEQDAVLDEIKREIIANLAW